MMKKMILAALPEGPLLDALATWSLSNGATLRRVDPDAPDLIAMRFDLAIVDTRYYRDRYFEYLEYVSQLAEELDREEASLTDDEKAPHEALLSDFMAAGRVICIEPEWLGHSLTLPSPTPEYLVKILDLATSFFDAAPPWER